MSSSSVSLTFWRELWLIVLNNKSVSNSKFLSVGVTKHHTPCRTSSGWWIRVVSGGTALTSMNKHIWSATHFGGFLRLKIESAWSLDRRIMHSVFAVSKFIDSGGERSSVNDTLISRVEVPSTLSTVGKGIDCPFARASLEPSSVLVEVVCHGWSWGEGLTTVLCARFVSEKRRIFLSKPGKSDRNLHNYKEADKDLERFHEIGILILIV